MTLTAIDVSVVIRTYTEARWDDLVAAVESVQRQTLPPREIIVVADHNTALLQRVRGDIPGVVVVDNREPRGASGALNSGIAAARGALIAFLDDDATAAPDWLERLVEGYEDPQVLGIGGTLEPTWETERPKWFPDEFNWVVGCTYRGMPERTAPVPRLIGANMSFRRSILEGLGGFRNGVGAVGAALTKCEDTEFSIRVYHRWRRGLLIHEPRAKVHHRVPASRARWCYFRSRCYGEGIAKFQVSRLMGIRDGLGPELGFISRTLPLGVARGLAEAVTHADLASLARAGAIVAGLAFTMAGFLIAVISAQFAIPRHTLNGSVVTPELAERGPKQGLQATSSVLKE